MTSKRDTPLTPSRLLPIAVSMNLKRQLQFYLDRRDMNASQLAKKASVPKQSLSGWLAGSNPRDVRQVKRVADALSVTLDHLMFGEGDDPNISKTGGLAELLGDEWVSGAFEVKIRRIRKG